jgi:predicted outer membrane repeat protein
MNPTNGIKWGEVFTKALMPVLWSLAVLAFGGRAAATTYNPVNGAAGTGKCNLTDAIQAASTNTAVHGCAKGSSTGTDTIQLAANTTYVGYGKTLLVPATGGALVIRGNANLTGIIRAPNYGYPSPSPLAGSGVCPFPAAIFSGGTLTLQDVVLQASETDVTGICQYAGSLTLNHVFLGDGFYQYGFNGGGIWSHPNTTSLTTGNNHRTLNLTSNTTLWSNYSPHVGGGISLFGDVVTTISNCEIEHSFSDDFGGALAWSGTWQKMGDVTITNTVFSYNESASSGFKGGGALYLDGDDANALVTLDRVNIEQNDAAERGGAIYVGNGLGNDKLVLRNQTSLTNNTSVEDPQTESFNADSFTYLIVSCNGNSIVNAVVSSEWSAHSPPLKGDGTCVFPIP